MPRLSTRIPGVAMNTRARAMLRGLLGQVPAGEQARVRDLFRVASGADGNRYLSEGEAQLVQDAFEAHRGPEGFHTEEATRTLLDRLERIASARNSDGVRTFFTSNHPNLGEVISEQMRDIVAQAQGKPVDFNVLLFAFTDKDIANTILDLAEHNPNVRFHFVLDWSQIPSTGGRQAARLMRLARERNLEDQIQIKFKKDDPYVWNARARGPAYNHGASDGLNHHKGFVALVDGQPFRLVTGSFNWSKTAARSNFENLFVFDRTNPINRALMESYQSEFLSFYNHPDTVNVDEADVYRRDLYNALKIANGAQPSPRLPPAAPSPLYVPPAASDSFDVNHLSDANYENLKKACGSSTVARAVVYQISTYGRVDSFEELCERVKGVRDLPEEQRERLRGMLEFGDGRVPINHASLSELMRSLKIPRKTATAIVAARTRVGDFESVEDLRNVPGVSEAVYRRIAPLVNDDAARVLFSARPISARGPATGYAAINADRRVPVMGLDGVVMSQEAKLTTAIVDLMRRAPAGSEAKIAMYGMSSTIESYDAIVGAARRGVPAKVVLNRAYNEGVANELVRLAREEGLPIEVRFTTRTMHQKFGVVNDDCFFGSANMSGSATSKHSEDRFLVKNNPELAKELDDEFERLWEVARPA